MLDGTGVDGESFRVDYVSTGIQKDLVIERQVLVGEKIPQREHRAIIRYPAMRVTLG